MLFQAHPLPLAIVRLRRWYLVPVLMFIAGAVYPRYLTLLPTWARNELTFLSIFAAMFAAIALIIALEWRLRRRAAHAGSRLCPECLYPLEGNAGICPECGRPFKINELADLWHWR